MVVGVLIATNLVTLAVLCAVLAWRRHTPEELPLQRQVITVEILNPGEVAARRGGRLAVLARTFAPELIRRIVYEQTLKTLRRELAAQGVHADVQLQTASAARTSTTPPVVDLAAVDEAPPLDLRPPPG